MATHADIVFVCPQENGQLLSHPVGKLEGKLNVYVCVYVLSISPYEDQRSGPHVAKPGCLGVMICI